MCLHFSIYILPPFIESCLRAAASFDLPKSHLSLGRDTIYIVMSLYLSQHPAVSVFQLFPTRLLEIHANVFFLTSSASCPVWKAWNTSLKWLFNKFHKDAKLPKMML